MFDRRAFFAPPEGIPRDSPEYQLANDIWHQLNTLPDFADRFAHALQLFEFVSEAPVGQLRSPWQFIAARDAVMNVHHLATAIQNVRETLYLSPIYKGQADISLLRSAASTLASEFPGIDLIRHQLAHAGERWGSTRKKTEAAITGPAEVAGISLEIGASVTIGESLAGNTFAITAGRQVLSCEISHETLLRIHAIIDIVAAAFQGPR